MERLGQELRHAARRLLLAPSFTGAAVLTLALAIGATVSIFAVVQRVVLNPLPYPKSDRLIEIRHADGLGMGADSYAHYASRARTLEGVAIWDDTEITLTGRGDPERLRIARVTPSLASVLRVAPAQGRWLDETQEGGVLTAVLSYPLWMRRYGGDPAIIGQSVTVNGAPLQVIGVMAEGFAYPDRDIGMWINDERLTRFAGLGLITHTGVARLRDGVTIEDARTELTRLVTDLPNAYPGSPRVANLAKTLKTSAPITLKEATIGDVERALWILLAAVGLVLLVACANVANLFLVRSDARTGRSGRSSRAWRRPQRDCPPVHRRKPDSVGGRGGGRSYARVGCGANARGDWPNDAATVARDSAGWIRRGAHGRPESCCGLDPGDASAAAGGACPASRHRPRCRAWRRTLSHQAIAHGCASRAGDGAARSVGADGPQLSESAIGRSRIRSGIDADVPPWTTGRQYPDHTRLVGAHLAIVERLSALPGTVAAAAANCLPLENVRCVSGPVRVAGRQLVEGAPAPEVWLHGVTAGYFEAMAMRIQRGRGIDRDDVARRQMVVVVNQALADAYFPGQDPLGQRVTHGSDDIWGTIVGVVADTPTAALRERRREPKLYMPMSVTDPGRLGGPNPANVSYIVRTAVSSPLSLMPSVRQSVALVDDSLAIAEPRTLHDIVDRASAQMAFTMILLAIAAGVALTLGAIGIYGAMSYIVSQRTGEIGLRVALGARPRSVATLIGRQGGSVALAGIGVGTVGALAAGRFIESLLYDISPRDPEVFAAIVLLLLLGFHDAASA